MIHTPWPWWSNDYTATADEPSQISLAALTVQQGLAEAGVMPGPDTTCVVWHRDRGPGARVARGEHRFMPGADVCICGQVAYVSDGFRGRPTVIVEERP